MRSFLFALPLVALAACANQAPQDLSKVNAKAAALAAMVENAAAVYMGGNSVDPAVKAKVQAAEAAMDALIASLPMTTTANVADNVDLVVKSVNAVVDVLPPQVATDKFRADVAAAELVIQGIVVAAQ